MTRMLFSSRKVFYLLSCIMLCIAHGLNWRLLPTISLLQSADNADSAAASIIPDVKAQHPDGRVLHIGNNASTASQPVVAEVPVDCRSIYPNVVDLLIKYKGKMVCVNSIHFPHCEFYLCGTLHVAKNSVNMVKDIIQESRPNYVVLELCEARIDNLDDFDEDAEAAANNITLADVVRGSLEKKSFKNFGMGLLTWLQLKAAKIMGSKLGGELSVAAKEAYKCGATVILGDRLYSVTIQRIFDRLRLWEKIKFVFVVIWEIVTMSLFKIKDYIQKSEDDDQFIKDEISRFAKHMPSFADVVITERDEYLAQTLAELARVGFGKLPPPGVEFYRKGKILAVVGAGHLPGVAQHLLNGGIHSAERIAAISSSSKHNSTWPGAGVLQVVDLDSLYAQKLFA